MNDRSLIRPVEQISIINRNNDNEETPQQVPQVPQVPQENFPEPRQESENIH